MLAPSLGRLLAQLYPGRDAFIECMSSRIAELVEGPAAAATTVAAAAAAPGLQEHACLANPVVASAAFFAPPADGRCRGPAAAAAAKAAAVALRQASEASAAATVVEEPRSLPLERLAALPPPRLGEIAAPSPLPYSLRTAQAVRALAAAAPASSSSDGSCGGGGSLLLLRIAADPSLPPIPCPPAAAAQCGELVRLLQVLEEEQAAATASSSGRQPRQLALHGVAPEEHAALRQLVRCLSGRTHAGLLEATLLLDVARLADLLDAPALLRECTATLACMAPGPEVFAPLLALAEARQYHPALQHLKLFYTHALALHLLEGHECLLRWALHGLAAGVDAILEVCTSVAACWLPLEPGLGLGSPAGDLAALRSPQWQAAAPAQQERVCALLQALLPLLRLQLEHAEQAPAAKKARIGPFQSAAVKPRAKAANPRTLCDAALTRAVEEALQQLQRALPRLAAHQRQQRTAAAFAAAEARARRHRQLVDRGRMRA